MLLDDESYESGNYIFNFFIPEDFLDNPLPIKLNNSEEYKPKLTIEIPTDETDYTKYILKSKNTDNISKPKKTKGRKPKKYENSNNSEIKFHDKFKTDNLFKKIQTHFFAFIANYHNVIFEELGLINNKQILKKISYKYIKNLKIKKLNSLLNTSIKQLLEKEISHRFKSKREDKKNILILEKLINNELVNKLLSETYINLFRNIYYKSERIINLKNYGLNINIYLPYNKVEMYSDLKERNNIGLEGKKYIQRLDKYINKKFFAIK